MLEHRLRFDQTRRLLDLAQEASSVSNRTARWRLLLAGLADIVSADVGLFAVDPPHFRYDGTGRVPESVEHGMDDATRRAMMASFTQPIPSPGTAYLLAHRDELSHAGAITIARHELLSDAEWHGSGYFSRYMRPSRLDHFIYSLRPAFGSGRVFGVTLHRHAGARAFDIEDRSLVHLFQLQVAPRLLGPMSQPDAAEEGPRLPPRQRQVLARLLAGDAEKEIAARLGLTPNTVHQYVKAVYRVLGVSSRAQLLARCLGAEQ